MSPSLTAGARLGRYEIRSKLGEGGMGEVYLALDTTELERTVAIKVLTAEVASDPKRMQRFVQEARTVSALNHPNILTIHEFGQEGATRFIVTEHVDGVTLREYLTTSQARPVSDGNPVGTRRLKSHDVLEIAIQIAAALDAAHEAKVVHRDIKPDNVMVRRRDAIVKVLDFGLAKPTERSVSGQIDSEAGTRVLTEPGVVMGTVSYMSPEQSGGLAPVDHRTDTWSLGVVLYEMITGRLPFEGKDVHRQIIAIQETDPAPLSRYAEGVPDRLEDIVAKALAKDPNERYQTAKDFLIDLRNLRRKLDVDAEIDRTAAPGLRGGGLISARGEEPTIATATGATVATAPLSVEYLVSQIQRHKRGATLVLAALGISVAIVAYFIYVKHNRAPVLTAQDTILLTDFDNKTGDAVFDGTLKQALAVHLGQSPFLNIFSDERVRETLRLMNRAPEERVTPAIGREICQRHGLKALLTGSIASLGRNYVISLEAVNAQTGEALAREQIEAEGKEQVLRSLGQAATRLREKLGESLSSIQKFDAPLEQATTSSLEALKAFSMGSDQNLRGKYFDAISSLKLAIELDPNFASAYRDLAVNYGNTRQPALAAEAARKAFELRERVSEREKLHIAYSYYSQETGEISKAIEALELCQQTYPRDVDARGNLGVRYSSIGQAEKALEEYLEALRLNPSMGITRSNLSSTYIRLNRFDEARAMGEQAIALKFDSAAIHRNLYQVAFVRGDAAAMKQQVDWGSGRPGEYAHLSWQADAAAFSGQRQKAQEFSSHAAELALHRNLQEVAGEIISSNAEWSAVMGRCQQGRADIARAVALPRTPTSLLRAGIAMALCGDAVQVQALNDEASKRYPKFTLVNEIYLPLIRAALELQQGNRTQSIQMLEPVSRYESVSFFYENYLRGQAWLGERKGAEAAGEFQKILDHRGWASVSPLYPLAHLGLARAAMLQGDTTKARRSYQDFFALWKDADADLPILIEAKKEYETLK